MALSFVDISPSIVILLNESATASLNADFNAPFSIAASVVKNASMVAMSGHIMPAPFAAPAIFTFVGPIFISVTISFGTVSVVMIALANFGPFAFFSPFTKAPILDLIFFIGKGLPIIPVDAIKTWSGSKSRLLAATPVISSASLNSFFPTQQFALPLFTITAWLMPFFTLVSARTTEPDFILLVVKVAAQRHGTSE